MIRNLQSETLIKLLFVALATFLGFLILIVLGEKTYVTWAHTGIWHTADDHMITQRVAYNIWHFGQPYYNMNEPVAANTSLFWPYILSPIYSIFDNRTAIPVLIVLSTLMYSITIGVTITKAPDIKSAALISGALIFLPTSRIYSTTGWEHIPQSLFFTLAGVLMLTGTKKGQTSVPTLSLALMSLSFLMRPDTAIAAVIPGLVWLSETIHLKRYNRLIWLVIFLSAPVAYLFLMHFHYGTFSPNTANLKLNFGINAIISGIIYSFNPFAAGPVPYIVLLLVFFWQHLVKAEKIIVASMLLFLAYVCVVGGDAFGAGRFFLFLLPSASLVLALLVHRQFPTWKKCIGAVAAFVVLLLNAPAIIQAGIREELPFAGHADSIDSLSDRIRISQIINSRINPSDGSIGLHWLGVGYHMPRFHIVDFLGKAEPKIAQMVPIAGLRVGHNKFDYAYAFSRYNIAAFPIDEYACRTAEERISEASSPNTLDYYVLACFEALSSRRYTFIRPQELGIAGQIGLAVRNDLTDRFRQGDLP